MDSVSLIAAVSSLLSKYYLSRKSVYGWCFGMLGALFACFISYINNLLIASVLDIYALLSYIFGFYKFYKHTNIQTYDMLINYLMIAITMACMLFMTYFLWGSETIIIELIMSFSFMIGVLFLAFKSINGWYLFSIGHILLGYLYYSKELYIMFMFQILSLSIALYTIYQHYTLPQEKN